MDFQMPRPKNYTLHNFFAANEKNEILCYNGKCPGKILNKHTANLERHLKVVHPDLYAYYMEQKCGFKSKNNEIIKIKTKLPKEENKRNIELAIVELFTKNARPLSMIEDRAFKILVQPVFDALNLHVNSQSVNDRIVAFSKQLKREIREDIKGRLLSLKIDSMTRQDLNFLGINVQYVKNKMITVKTLAIQELKSSHVIEDLNSVILEVISDYSIDINQILTITTDNGSYTLQDDNDLSTVSLEEEYIDENAEETIDMESIRSEFVSYGITNIRCGANVLQLCVQDVFNNPQIKEHLDLCRSVSKNLRSETYRDILTNGHYKRPILDSVTRWSSTYNMLERMLELQETIDSLSSDNSALSISADIWSFIKEFINVFRPLYTSTVKLQSQQLCFSELYVILMDVLIQVKSMPSTEMTVLLINSLNERKNKLFNNELFNAAIFLDPRIKVCLNLEQTTRAKNYITSLHERIVSLKETNPNFLENTTHEDITIKDEPSSSSYREPAKTFSDFLQSLDSVATNNDPNATLLSNLESDLRSYDHQQRIPLDSNILEFWTNQNNTLAMIAEVVLAIPSTHVSVERLFSALKYILADQQSRLTPFILEHVLFVKFNGVFNYDD